MFVPSPPKKQCSLRMELNTSLYPPLRVNTEEFVRYIPSAWHTVGGGVEIFVRTEVYSLTYSCSYL